MTINDNVKLFAGFSVEDFDKDQGINKSKDVVYRLRIDYETAEDFESRSKPQSQEKKGLLGKLFGKSTSESEQSAPAYDNAFQELFDAFVSDPNVGDTTALVIGDWGQCGMGDSSEIVVAELVKAKDKLSNLRHLFIGDITMEESEISWITQSDVSALWSAYPNLETFRIRGGNELSLGKLSLSKLETLIVESGGLPSNILDEVNSGTLPELKHLELWLGDDGYGWDGSINQLKEVLAGTQFPKLKYLGLRDSQDADEIAKVVSESAVLSSLEVLDMSLGVLSDKGVEALLAVDLSGLKKLDIHHHYVSEEFVSKLEALDCEVDCSEKQEDDRDGDEVYRYVAVSE